MDKFRGTKLSALEGFHCTLYVHVYFVGEEHEHMIIKYTCISK